MRPFCKFGEVNVYANEQTANGLRHTVPYCFAEHRYPGAPKISLHTIKPHQQLHVADLDITPIEVMHDRLPILGYRIGSLLYITDMKTIAETEYPYITGIKTLVVNALRFTPEHHSHQNVADAIDFANRVGAERTYLIHMGHDVGLHAEVNQYLPNNIQLAYDGEVITITEQ